jgi:microcystin-dependent protein
MALESASFIAGLNQANPLATDSVAQADDHIRLIKAVLKNTFPNLTGAVTATQSQLNTPVPVGFIGMWSGSTATVPTGWALCDGTNGTPDLRDRFIVGAGSTYAVGATGGANTVTLTTSQIPSHSHDISSVGVTNTVGAHTHAYTDPGHFHTSTWSNINDFNQGSATPPGAEAFPDDNTGTFTVNTDTKTTGITIQTAGDHAHSLNITSSATVTGGGAAHENRPPYYALAYIMKV